MKLVIVESPSKIKSIKKYLGAGYEVQASRGHFVDLPKSDLGVDTENKYKPKYVVSARKSLQLLKKAYQDTNTLIIATDPDREGEAIGWHVANRLGVITDTGKLRKGHNLQRIVFTSITKDAVQQAIKNPRSIDFNLFNAQQARRVLDRLVGYKLSPLLWKKIRFGLSAGRVQSVALRLIVEREEERDKFLAEEYWSIKALTDLKSSGKCKSQIVYDKDENKKETTKDFSGILFELTKVDNKKPKLTTEDQSQEIAKLAQNAVWQISNLVKNQTKRSPKPPFTTSTLQQTASGWLGFSAKRTMSVAQKLYEQGLITYMRTDSTNLSPDAVTKAREVIAKKYGDKYLPDKPRFYKTKAKVAQEAHEAIRATDFNKTPESVNLDGDFLKLYRLIWQRSLACQMNPALINKTKLEVLLKTDKNLLFTANGQQMLFDGYLKVYPEKFETQVLPELEVGTDIYPQTIISRQHFTQPPARYSEATLIKTLESYGIGRPSTYVPTLTTIQTRKYVEKEGKYFKPTDTGKIVTHLLRDHFPKIVDYQFTAKVEDDLDNIANGKKDWVKMIDDFYQPFLKNLNLKDKQIDRENYTVLGDAPDDIKCPECKGKMNIKLGRYGRFYSCKKWPDCKGMLGEDGKSDDQKNADLLAELASEKFKETYKSAPKTDDGRDYLLKVGRYGKFWAHPDYPKVKDAKPLELNDKIKTKIYGKAPIAKDGKTKLILRRGRFGEFWAHPDYPKVKEVVRINKKDVAEKKKELGV